MKMLIAVLGMLASSHALAFWDAGNGSASTAQDGTGSFVGNGSGEAEGTFSMDFKGKSRQTRSFSGNAESDGSFSGYGYDAPYGYPQNVQPQAPSGN